MAENKDKSKIPYYMSNTGDNEMTNTEDNEMTVTGDNEIRDTGDNKTADIGNNDTINTEDNIYQYQGPEFDYNNYQYNYRNDQYTNAYGNFFGGYCPTYGFNQNFPPPYPGFYGFPPFQHPPGPPQGPPEPQGPLDKPCNASEQDFNANGPPVRKKQIEDKIIKALIRCGIPKDNLKNLPRNLLKQYQPEHCGLCSQSFDTMTMSRLHYICKNHLKNQKKWLSQQTHSGFRRNKEQPLRARELYCEICDVHITSKVHSESHYAGKPHKSIVEGRKNPKNPFLMQRGMEDRLEQLIRREKKHLFLGEDEGSDIKEAKAVQPELCCEICDTSVTCTDQMIMHLNGKRHLAKEKQHILRMMKGDGLRAGVRDNYTIKPGKERDARNIEEEKCEFENRPDSWDILRNKLSLTSG